MAQLPILELRTHAQKVCNLYKRHIKNLESWYHIRTDFRYEAVLMRQRFDENKGETDMAKAKQMLADGEKQLKCRLNYDLKKFAYSPGGVAYNRHFDTPDWILDAWHPLEKAQYPEYFKRRENRKKEYVDWYVKEYGPDAEKCLKEQNKNHISDY